MALLEIIHKAVVVVIDQYKHWYSTNSTNKVCFS